MLVWRDCGCKLQPTVIDQLHVLEGWAIILSENSGTKGASAQSEKAGDAWLGIVGSGEQVLMVLHHRIVLYSIIDEGYSGNKPFTVSRLTCHGAQSVP